MLEIYDQLKNVGIRQSASTQGSTVILALLAKHLNMFQLWDVTELGLVQGGCGRREDGEERAAKIWSVLSEGGKYVLSQGHMNSLDTLFIHSIIW